MVPGFQGTSTWEPGFEEIFELSLDLLCIAGFDGYFKRVNLAFEDAFGYTSEELLSRPFLDFVHPEDRARAGGAFERLVRGEEVLRFENRNICADGSTLWLEWSGRPMPSERVFYGAARDITDRKRAEEWLREAQEHVEATRDELRRRSEEEAALRRVATLVAQGVSRPEVFESVTCEVGMLSGADLARMERYEPDGTVTGVAGWSRSADPELAVGTQFALEGVSIAALVQRSASPVRVDNFADASGPIAEEARSLGIRSSVGCPIVIAGTLWGVIAASSRSETPFPPDIESRMAEFTELVATAIANAENQDELRIRSEEEAALRRVATLVARGVPRTEVLDVVTAEVERLLGADWAVLVRYDPDDSATVLASRGRIAAGVVVGSRAMLEDESLEGLVKRTGRSARVEYESAPGRWAAQARKLGARSGVGAPIKVEGRVWGALAATWGRETPLADAEAEARIGKLAELVATAIANAESRDQLRMRSEEQAALRRVATLVARGIAPADLFEAVCAEVGQLITADGAALTRFEPDGTVTALGGWTSTGGYVYSGRRFALDGTVSGRVLDAGGPARIDDYTVETSTAVLAAREMGWRSSVGAPVILSGHLWGVLAVISKDEPLPPDTEDRLVEFTELVATAIANSENRAELDVRSEEQAALRRVATHIARGVSPSDIFSVVAEEVHRLFEADSAAIGRFEPDGAMVVVGQAKSAGMAPIKKRWELADPMATATVLRTGRSARMDADDLDDASGSVTDAVKRIGVRSSVASPIVVEGRLWGVMVVSTGGEPLSPDTEERLERFTELVATAIANAESRAELDASRARIVATADATRRRIERDLHDGAQQQLVALALEARAAQAAVPPELGELRTELSGIVDGLTGALDGLREIALGIHPAILAEGGLGPALKTLARRSPVPVELDVPVEARYPEPAEVAAYYVVSEALTNAAKYAQASVVRVEVEAQGDTLRIAVRDDGVGGADPARGSGLLGLKDRAEALGGRIRLESARGSGTSLQVDLPLADGEP
jgi:PAS domain S-box-containing protein